MADNNLTRYRLRAMMSVHELAKNASVSAITVSRVEEGFDCHIGTVRKIIKALADEFVKTGIEAPPSVKDVFPDYEIFAQEDNKSKAAREPEKVMAHKQVSPVYRRLKK